ncbi:hypothetical protein ABVC96_20840 [Xanthomonas euvesicatoria]|nr:hypothetical protein [Xanthomonas phage MYK3]
MNGRLYRLTPAGGKPNHYTDSYASALAVLGAHWQSDLDRLQPGQTARRDDVAGATVERVA